MKRLHSLIIKSFLGPMVLTFFLVIFILLMQFMWKYIDDLVGKGLDTKVLAEFLFYSCVSMVGMAVPLAVLLSSLMTFGNLAENLELLAFKSAGVSLTRIMAPLFFVVVIITIGTFFFANNIMPISNMKLYALLHDIKRQRPEMQIQPGIFDNTLEGYSIRIGDQNETTKLLEDIWIYDHTDKAGNVSVTVADSGFMKISNDEKHLILTLYNGHSYVELQKTKKRNAPKTYPHRRDKFSKQEMLIEMTGFGLTRTDFKTYSSSFAMMNLNQLVMMEDSLHRTVEGLSHSVNDVVSKSTLKSRKRSLYIPVNKLDSTDLADEIQETICINVDSAYNALNPREKRRAVTQAINLARSNKSFVSTNANTMDYKASSLRRTQIEKNKKFTIALSCMIFFFIGAPLGAIIRKGGLGMPVIVSVLFFLVWYMISITGEKFAREAIMSPFAGVWLASFILIPLSIFLSYKASRDSVLLNLEAYSIFLKKLKSKLQKITKKL